MGCGRCIFGHIMGVNVRDSWVMGKWTMAVIGEVIGIQLTWGPWEVCVERIGSIQGVERQFHVVVS